jgi:hypothetical protein
MLHLGYKCQKLHIWWASYSSQGQKYNKGCLRWTLLPLKVFMPWALGFFTYSSIKEHFTSIVGLKGNKSYNCQSLQLRNNEFWVWGGLATANPSKISISQFWTMSTFHMARALLTKTMLMVQVPKASSTYTIRQLQVPKMRYKI